MIRRSFDANWYVERSDVEDASRIGPVTLPYDAMLAEERDPDTKNGGHTGFYPGGVYRYSKTFVAPEEWRDRTVVLEFEGVYQHSEVFLNGALIGGRPSGYALFEVELQGHLLVGEENILEVVADNSVGPNGRWYTGSGIYRPTHLLIGGPVRVTSSGLRLATRSVDGDSAVVNIETRIVNDEAVEQAVAVVVTLTSPDGADVASVRREIAVPANSVRTLTQSATVPGADLWTPDTPHLHVATAELVIDGEVVDSAVDEFGIRIVTADPGRGLLVNGVPVKLRGSAVHHDHGVIGAVALDAAEDRRIRLLKESGFNAVRSAHNPASRAMLRACDRHGVFVMDELTDAWTTPKVQHDYSEIFLVWWERDLEALVANAYNHPSVIMYSIGNEISETAAPSGVALNRMLAERTRELDPSRLVTNGINGFLNLIAPRRDVPADSQKETRAEASDEAPNKNMIRVLNAIMGILDKMLDRIVRLPAVDKRTRDAFADLDVAGYNYMVGRYELDGKLHPDRLIVGSETRSTQTPIISRKIETLPYVLGDFAWTGWDYVGEAGLAAKIYGTTKRSIYHPYPALLAGEPVFDITGFRQTQSHVNEIGWRRTQGPYIAVEPVNHSGEKSVKTGWRYTNSISSWSWAGLEGRAATVEVYADAATVTLLLDDRTVGTAKPSTDGTFVARFTLPYQPGTLTAVAYADTGDEIGRSDLTSAGTGLRLTVTPESSRLVADGKDLIYVPITITDHGGTTLPLADRPVTVRVDGAGTLAGFGSAEAITTEALSATTHRTFYGRALAVIRATHIEGTITLTVTAADCEPVTVALTAEPSPLSVADAVPNS